ncbi:MAG: dynamin family protein [Ruminococcus sp.]|jgi:GTPase Era involved in 16S rRNA processing|nr:dynamin family protein [Ruminococcus sp.]
MEQTIQYGSYSAYKATVAEIVEELEKLREFADSLALVKTSGSITETLEKAVKEHFEVAVVGEFKRGKSTIINAILGEDVLPSDVLPATAALNRITYSSDPFVIVEFKDGSEVRVPVEKLSDYVTKLTFESERTAENVKQATVYYDTAFCKNNVDIIDTPGLNDDEQMTNVTLSILPEIDAAVFVISANSPFSQFEKEFLENKMLTSDLGRIIFAVNCFGTFSKEDEERIVETVRRRIESYVMEKAKQVMGEGSKEFAVYKRKIGTPRVFGVYAKKALTAKEQGDETALAESNFPQFEQALEHMLTVERGSIALQILANKIISSGSEILNIILLRENALMMETDEFMDKYRDATAEIDDIRTKKRLEFVKINDAAANVYGGLKPILESYWQQIEDTAMDVVDGFMMSADDLKKDNLKKVHMRITDKIRDNIENKAQLICEQIQNEINIALSDEASRLQGFENEFFASVNRIQEMFSLSANRGRRAGGAVDSVISVVLGTVGTGGLFIGMREAGIKGALLGGASGLLSSGAIAATGFVLAGVLGIVGGPVTLTILALAGLTGAFAGKFSVEKFLSDERIEKFKQNLKLAVHKQFKEMKINSDFSETVRQQVYASFEGLKTKIEKETEAILADTQTTLDRLNQMKEERKELSETERERLGNMAEYIGGLLAESYNLHKQLSSDME